MNNQANIIGIRFNAFDLKNYYKLKVFLSVMTVLMVAALFHSLIFNYGDQLNEFAYGFDYLTRSIFYISVIGLTFASLFIFAASPFMLFDYVLSKVHADHKLKEFDLTNETLKKVVQDDIEKNGYFSANGYWELYFSSKQLMQEKEYEAEKEKKSKELITKYPDIFNEKQEK